MFEQGVVYCSPGAMMAVVETPSTGVFGLQDPATERELLGRVTQSVLGWRCGLGTKHFASTVGIIKATIRQYVLHQGDQGDGSSVDWIVRRLRL